MISVITILAVAGIWFDKFPACCRLNHKNTLCNKNTSGKQILIPELKAEDIVIKFHII